MKKFDRPGKNKTEPTDAALDNTVAKLRFTPTDEMFEDKNGCWRYKAGTIDELGRKIGGNIVKGSPSNNPDGRSGREKEVLAYFREISMDAAETLYTIMMDPNEASKIRTMTADMILNRSLGRPKVAEEDKSAEDSLRDLIRPIILQVKSEDGQT